MAVSGVVCWNGMEGLDPDMRRDGGLGGWEGGELLAPAEGKSLDRD